MMAFHIPFLAVTNDQDARVAYAVLVPLNLWLLAVNLTTLTVIVFPQWGFR